MGVCRGPPSTPVLSWGSPTAPWGQNDRVSLSLMQNWRPDGPTVKTFRVTHYHLLTLRSRGHSSTTGDVLATTAGARVLQAHVVESPDVTGTHAHRAAARQAPAPVAAVLGTLLSAAVCGSTWGPVSASCATSWVTGFFRQPLRKAPLLPHLSYR